jgi:hypothetical protein
MALHLRSKVISPNPDLGKVTLESEQTHRPQSRIQFGYDAEEQLETGG